MDSGDTLAVRMESPAPVKGPVTAGNARARPAKANVPARTAPTDEIAIGETGRRMLLIVLSVIAATRLCLGADAFVGRAIFADLTEGREPLAVLFVACLPGSVLTASLRVVTAADLRVVVDLALAAVAFAFVVFVVAVVFVVVSFAVGRGETLFGLFTVVFLTGVLLVALFIVFLEVARALLVLAVLAVVTDLLVACAFEAAAFVVVFLAALAVLTVVVSTFADAVLLGSTTCMGSLRICPLSALLYLARSFPWQYLLACPLFPERFPLLCFLRRRRKDHDLVSRDRH